MSEAKIKAIIKRPDERVGHMTNISPSLKNLQRIVDGPIEIVTIKPGLVLICNEEGKLRKLERNFRIGIDFFDVIVGEVIICGVDGEDLADIPISFKEWKYYLQAWGNTI